ncbi:ATP-binding cassette domain-containing protein [Microbispora amethystogenes]|uniref:ABC transporter ATP-binding protein n=1 Tax=Microbispora amethystogenes TaxID=1427754 RepID=A0ABQ4FMH5_9ACTN|nr:ABC transporter ATP-binding protein [Microbispora amethystogenes]GIH35972.1 ABC transporter ATP-binding protein [Microbispora amethystogenes]
MSAVTTARRQSPPASPPPAGDRAQGPWRLLAALLRRRPRPLALVMAWSIVEAAPALLSGLLVATAVDRGFRAGRPGLGLVLLGLLAAAMLVGAIATRLMFPHLAAVVEPLRDDLVRAVVEATVTHASAGEQAPDGAAVNRLTEQIETVRALLSAVLRNTRQVGVAVVAAVAGLLLLSPLAAAVVAGPVLVAAFAFVRLLRLLAARQRDLLLAGERLTAEVTPALGGLRDIAACGARDQARESVRSLVAAQAAAMRALAWAGARRRLVVTIGAHVPMVALLLAAGPLTASGRLTAGEIVGALTYLSTGLEPAVRTLLGTVGSWGITLAVTAQRLGDVVTPLPPRDEPACVPETPVGHDLRTDRLTFAYSPRAEPVVRELDLTVGEGEHLVVVGPSGIGKSTLAMLLSGLRRPTEGVVRLGGLALDAVPRRHLHEVVALVPQEAYVFAGTVRENLGYLRPAGEATADERLLAAADAVGAGPLLTRLGGLDGAIDEPSTLSAGERQLVTLARAYASRARIVILDEATCHLDPAGEARAEAAFAARQGTLIVIAHRVSSAARADRVLLLDGARAITGTHRDLVTRSPLYADLVGHWNHDAPGRDRLPE